MLTSEILNRQSTITKNEIILWSRDLEGDVFVTDQGKPLLTIKQLEDMSINLISNVD